MSSCCRLEPLPGNPDVIMAGNRPTQPSGMEPHPQSSSRESTRLIERMLCSVPSSGTRDLRTVLVDIGLRQEELFRQLLDQQKRVETQLISVQSASMAHTEAQVNLQQCQETFLCEFRGLFSEAVQNVAQNGVKNHHTVEDKPTVQSGTGEFVGSIKPAGSTAVSEEVDDPISPTFSNKSASDLQDGQWKSKQSSRSAPSQTKLQLHQQGGSGIIVNEGSIQGRLVKWLKSKEMELFVALAIIANAIVMCAECQYRGLDVGYNLQYPGRAVAADAVWIGAETAFTIFDWFFGLLFACEMLVKFAVFRHRYIYDAEGKAAGFLCFRFGGGLQGWNLLDFLCVVAFLFDKMAPVSAVNPQMLRLLRLFRLFRLVRLLRFLETLDYLYVMTTAISGLGKVLFWAILLLSVMLLMCNLFIVQILQATYFNEVAASDLSDDALKKHHQMYAYFGTCTRCMLSMFEITLGNWPVVARLLSEEASQWFSLFCILHKLTIGFAVMGVITGVILQETFKVAQTDDIIMFRQKKNASRILRNKMQTLFDTLDAEGDGSIGYEEFITIADDPDIKVWLASLDIETDDLNTLFQLIDEDGSGSITLDELISRMPRIKGFARSIDMMALAKKFAEAKPR